MYFYRSLVVLPQMPAELDQLVEIAKNLWWSWEPEADQLFRWLDEELWESLGRNPCAFVLSLSQERLAEAAANPDYLDLYQDFVKRFKQYNSRPGWYEKQYPEWKDFSIAYLSAEFGIHESLPIYSGGLGILAGDHLKAASDLGVPLVAVGLLYKSGYFSQIIKPDGGQEAYYPRLNFRQMPVCPLSRPDGSEVRVEVELPGRTIGLRVWECRIGRVRLYLLDADTSHNSASDRLLTGSLYGGDQEMRLTQEILLGIGGVKALRVLGINPTVWHVNEGHAAFSIIERLRELVNQGLDIDTAREVIRASTIFTTHTPVPAGHDVFSPELLLPYFGDTNHKLGLDRDAFINLAYDTQRKAFNMSLLALKHSTFTNAVSKLHGETTRGMFQVFYPEVPVEEIPITTLTNGVHIETWLAREWVPYFTRLVGESWRTPDSNPEAWARIAQMPAADIWETRKKLKAKMLAKVRESLLNQRQRYYASPSQQEEIESYLPSDTLTVVFSRRFATYKRAYLLFTDRERLSRMINDPEWPIQFIFAGKAHPADYEAQGLISQVYQYSQQQEFRGKIVFVEDLNMEMAKYLVQGADLWLNTPRRPLEACGTSGQKAVLNGAIHLSTLDGWWAEAYNGENGYSIGKGDVFENEEQQDYYDSLALYNTLEDVIIPAYYRRNHGLPHDWISRIRHGWRSVPPMFNTGRMVREYTDRFYVPLMRRHESLVADNFNIARRIKDYKNLIIHNWNAVQITRLIVEEPKETRAGEHLQISAAVTLGTLLPQDVMVDVVLSDSFGRLLENVPKVAMTMVAAEGPHDYLFSALVPLTQGTFGFTVRVRPSSPDFMHWLELPLVKWAPEF